MQSRLLGGAVAVKAVWGAQAQALSPPSPQSPSLPQSGRGSGLLVTVFSELGKSIIQEVLGGYQASGSASSGAARRRRAGGPQHGRRHCSGAYW